MYSNASVEMSDDAIFYPPKLADTAMQNNILHKLILMLLTYDQN